MKPCCAAILAKLCIYEREYLRYTKCLSRGIEVVVSGKPEELVRQVLLYYLLYESGLFPDKIDVRTEQNNLDVAVYKPPAEESFRPWRAPVAIFEVKREETNLLDHENQLFRYMKERRTNTGMLFNGNDIIAYEKGSEGSPTKRCLESLSELRDWLYRLTCRNDPDASAFQQARDGYADSFIYLAEKYGKYTLHKFTFTLKNSPTLITGCCFRLQDQRVYYDLYGKYAAKKSLSFDRSEFDRLLSVVY
jgi:Type I restriction enzyme R protein N terminus (HSDR_N)